MKVSSDRRESGFTLIELLVVIIIIGILAAIAIPVFLNQRKKGVDASVKSDLRQLAMVMETYIADNPGANGTNVKADLDPYGFKKSPGGVYLATYNNVSGGYCLIGRNPGMTNYLVNSYFWYDSGAGGLLSTAPSTTRPPGSVSCDVNMGTWSSGL